jgi:hypothetical protein
MFYKATKKVRELVGALLAVEDGEDSALSEILVC